MFGNQAADVDDEVQCDRSNWYNHSTGARPAEFPLSIRTWHQNTSPGLQDSECLHNSRDDMKLKIMQPHISQSHLLSVGVAIGCWCNDGCSGRGLLDGGEADVGGAMQVAGLALGARTSTTSQLTEEKKKELTECTKSWRIFL